MACTIERTLNHALSLAQYLGHSDPNYIVLAILIELGFEPKQEGFHYLKSAIVMRCCDNTKQIGKQLYPEIAGANGLPGSGQVEQAIRGSIRSAWNRRNEQIWSYYFLPDRQGRIQRPSNSEMIARIACFVELWQGCCKEVVYAKQ